MTGRSCHFLIQWPNGCNSWNWDRPKLAAWSSIQISYMDVRTPGTWAISTVFPGTLPEGWIGRGASRSHSGTMIEVVVIWSRGSTCCVTMLGSWYLSDHHLLFVSFLFSVAFYLLRESLLAIKNQSLFYSEFGYYIAKPIILYRFQKI